MDGDDEVSRGSPPIDMPQVGEVLRRLRIARGLSLNGVASATGISGSFLSALERGESDISVGRLARLASFFDHDIGSLLGYSERRARPQVATPRDRLTIDRGDGIGYEVIRIPGVSLELVLMEFPPRSGFDRSMAHEGVDVMFVLEGRLNLIVSDQEYPINAGDCVTWSASYEHSVHNPANAPARAIGLTTERVY